MSEFKSAVPTIARPTPIDREVQWDKTKVLISETDAVGTITKVNDVFCEVSHYTAEELIGQPHNLIRHPDMPKLIFKLLWDNLKAGNNFVGVIKNLAKQGKDYIDFIIDIMNENRENVSFEENQVSSVDTTQVISDDIVTMNEAQNEKRKSFFGRLFVQ